MLNETKERGYERDYVDLPPVEEGDEVRVRYVSGQNDSEQERTGQVVEVHANGFTFVHESGDEGQATSVRDHEERIRDRPIRRNINTVKQRTEVDSESYVHATELNRTHRDPSETEVLVSETYRGSTDDEVREAIPEVGDL